MTVDLHPGFHSQKRKMRLCFAAIFLVLTLGNHSTAWLQENPMQPQSSGSTFWLSPEDQEHLSHLGRNGDANAAFRMAQFNTFVQQDADQRLLWLELAAEGGHAVAQYNLAYDLANGKSRDLTKAIYWATESLKNGNTAAANLLEELGEPPISAPR